MEAKFFLRHQAVNHIITLAVFDGRFPTRKFFYSTGLPLDPSEWKIPKRKNKDDNPIGYGYPKETAANNLLIDHLDKLADAVKEWGKTQIGKAGPKSLDREQLRKYLDAFTKNQGKQEQHAREERLKKESDFFTVWQEIIDTSKGNNGEKITVNTRLSKNQTLNLVTRYCLEKNLALTFESLDMKFYHEFGAYMATQGLSPNSIGKHFKEIKSIMREAHDRDIAVNASYLKKSFKVIRKDSESTYLNEDEIKKVLALKLSPSKEKIRDMFVMACYVGARHSDWHQIRKANIVDDKFMKVKQQKTGDAIHVPVHPVVRMLLNKYNGEPPKVISNQKFNEALKEIFKDETLLKDKGLKKKAEQGISTHTARRSFATNAYLSKSMSVYSIMACTGHRTEASFLKYLKLSGLDKAQDLAESKFFSDEGWRSLKVVA